MPLQVPRPPGSIAEAVARIVEDVGRHARAAEMGLPLEEVDGGKCLPAGIAAAAAATGKSAWTVRCWMKSGARTTPPPLDSCILLDRLRYETTGGDPLLYTLFGEAVSEFSGQTLGQVPLDHDEEFLAMASDMGRVLDAYREARTEARRRRGFTPGALSAVSGQLHKLSDRLAVIRRSIQTMGRGPRPRPGADDE